MLDNTCNIVFATNFSDACNSAIPSVARWVDQLKCKLTILHAYNPDRTLNRDARRLLESFFAEADNYPECERVLIAGDAAEGIARHCQSVRDALLLLPPSDQAGLPRPWHRSMRAQMIDRLQIPVWTLGRTIIGDPLPHAPNHIGVYVANPEEGQSHIRQAAQYAESLNATLHLLHVIPNVDEGSLAHSLRTSGPLGEQYAGEWLSDIAASLTPATKVELHLEQGSAKRVLPKLVYEAGIGMMMVSRDTALRQGILGQTLNPVLRTAGCSIMAVPHSAHLTPVSTHQTTADLLKVS